MVLYRGSAANGRAVQQYLTQNGAPELAAVIDLRTEPGEMPLQTAQLLTIADLPQGLTHLQLLDTVEVDLLHNQRRNPCGTGCRRLARRGQCGQADPGRSSGSGSVLRGWQLPGSHSGKGNFVQPANTQMAVQSGGYPCLLRCRKPDCVVRPGKVLCMRRCSPLLYSEPN